MENRRFILKGERLWHYKKRWREQLRLQFRIDHMAIFKAVWSIRLSQKMKEL